MEEMTTAVPEKRTKHWSDEDPKPTQQELIARAYNRKVDELGKAAADRLGRAYGTREVDWDKLVALWDEPAPDVDEAQVWDQEMDKLVQALADDPSLDRDEALAELPIVVAEIVYPQRRELIKSNGGTTYREWADFSDEIERRAALVRKPKPPMTVKKAAEPVPPPEPLAEPAPAGGMARPSMVPPQVPVPAEMPAAPPPAPSVMPLAG